MDPDGIIWRFSERNPHGRSRGMLTWSPVSRTALNQRLSAMRWPPPNSSLKLISALSTERYSAGWAVII